MFQRSIVACRAGLSGFLSNGDPGAAFASPNVMSATKKSVGIINRRRRMVYFSTVFEVYTATQSRCVHLLISSHAAGARARARDLSHGQTSPRCSSEHLRPAGPNRTHE